MRPGIALIDTWRVRLDVRVDGGANGDVIDARFRGSIEAAFRTLDTAAAFERREMVIRRFIASPRRVACGRAFQNGPERYFTVQRVVPLAVSVRGHEKKTRAGS